MANANLIIIRMLMILPSSMLGFLLRSILKKTGVLSPEKLAYPPGGHAVFYIFALTYTTRNQILQKNKLADAKIFEMDIRLRTSFFGVDGKKKINPK